MKKLIYSLPSELFEIFVVELNGYGIEILNRDEREVIFAIYSQNEELEGIKNVVQEIFEELGTGKLILEEEIKEENWEEKWKENFKPIKIPPFIIIPEWEIYKEKDLIPIKLKMGMAFGTGLHPSTQIMLSLVSQYVKKGDNVIDVGTGSGILAIASAKLGANVVAIDVQKEAIKECNENKWENQVEIKCMENSCDNLDLVFDIVLANLQIDIFRKCFQNLVEKFEKYLIISGIYKDKERVEILKLGEEFGLKLVKETKKQEEGKEGEEWYGFVFKHQ